jgi:hypothetical protein
MKYIVRGVIVLIVAAVIAWGMQFAIDTGNLSDFHFAEGLSLGVRVDGDGQGQGQGQGRRQQDGGVGEIFGTLITMTVISGVVVVGSKILQARRTQI